MTQDIILDTTVKFIRANKTNLQLAFQVEKALPEVRTELIKEFFKCVEKQLKPKVEAAKGWEIKATGTEGLWMRKKSWVRENLLKVSEDDWWGIMLYEEDGDCPCIGVANIEETSEEVKEQIMNEFRNKDIGEPDTNEQHIWVYLEDDIDYFKSCEFLTKMTDEEEQGKIVEDMADKLHKLADAVDSVFSKAG